MAGLPSAGTGSVTGWLVMIGLVVAAFLIYDYYKAHRTA